MKRQIRIARVIARLNVGGPAQHVVWLTKSLDQHGYETQLICGTTPVGEDDMTFFADQQGVKPHIIREMSRELSWKDAIVIWKLYRRFCKFRPDIIHTHTAKAGTVGRIAALLYRFLTPAALCGKPRPCKVLHTFHGHIFHSYYGHWKTALFVWIERILACLATHRILTISHQQKKEIQRDFRVGKEGQVSLLPIGLDLSRFGNSAANRAVFRKELGVGEEDTLVGIVGRLTEIKNHRLFIDVAHQFVINNPTARVTFVIIGDGQLRASLEEQVRHLGLSLKFRFVGSRNDAQCFYPALDIVALTSLNEGTPLSIIEALANTRSVIATQVGGVCDLLGEVEKADSRGFCVRQRGLTVPSGQRHVFCEALEELVREPSLREQLAKRGPAFVNKHYSKERLVRDIIDVYQDVHGSDVNIIRKEKLCAS